ncbi:MAG: MaoC family dehydratase [Candidatus Saccharicenans sp.]|uniref:MaoC family dehydratase n=1 Tax=Candidatus Saccharicenans sp. TaxID=2819258 RepID=UPI00404B0AF4
MVEEKNAQQPSPSGEDRKIKPRLLKKMLGQEFCVSDWLAITQERINAFAECTEDRQWIHVDVEKAARSPLKSTIAHGFLLLSLLPYFLAQSPLARIKVKMVFNYGLDRIRFIQPVKPGDRIRNRAVLKEIRRKGFRRWLVKIENTLEIENNPKPALVAELLVFIFF